MALILGQELFAQISALEQGLSTAAGQQEPAAALRTSFGMHGAALEAFKVMAKVLDAILKQNVNHGSLESILTKLADSSVDKYRKPLSEHKCISDLKMLGADREAFKEWNDKLISAICQVKGTSARKFMRTITEMIDVKRAPLTKDEYTEKAQEAGITKVNELSEDVYFVLMGKTESDAYLRVASAESGEGVEAYMRVYLWFAGTTGLALSEATSRAMRPATPNNDYEIADALERWME